MKKIIAAFDGLKYAESTKDYAVYIAGHTKTHLVGVFLDDPIYTSYKVYDLVVKDGVSQKKLKEYEEKDRAKRAAAAASFEKDCSKAKLQFSIHHDHNVAISALKHESIYSDLLIISSGETLTHYTEKPPTRFIRDLMGDVQCPVLLVPEKYKPLKKVILLYDGAPSSVFAVKMFSYLMPQLKHLETEVVSVKPFTSTLHLPDNRLMKEFMKRHYPNAKYKILKGFADEEIVKYLKDSGKNALVVTGAYRRGMVSRWFKESMADVLQRELELPLFIAHNK